MPTEVWQPPAAKDCEHCFSRLKTPLYQLQKLHFTVFYRSPCSHQDPSLAAGAVLYAYMPLKRNLGYTELRSRRLVFHPLFLRKCMQDSQVVLFAVNDFASGQNGGVESESVSRKACLDSVILGELKVSMAAKRETIVAVFKEKAKDTIFYSCKRHINGFSIVLEEEKAAQISMG